MRRARPRDAATVARHRFPTFPPTAPALDTYAAWVADALAREVYLGWLAEQEGVILAGVGLTLLEWGPTHDDPNPWRARLVNIFTEPASRRQGLARALTAHALGEAEARGLRSVSLAATREARALYEAFGFEPSPAQMRRKPGSQRRQPPG
nr:GNAT family N-acetyltransferase [Deinococcus aestuarii]